MGSTLPYVNGNVIPILCAHCYRRAMTRRPAFVPLPGGRPRSRTRPGRPRAPILPRLRWRAPVSPPPLFSAIAGRAATASLSFSRPMVSTLPYVNGNVIPILCAHCYRRAMTRRLAFALAATLLAVPPAPATETSTEKDIPGVADPYKTDVFDPDADPMADLEDALAAAQASGHRKSKRLHSNH